MGFTTKVRTEIHGKYNGRCAYCGRPITQRQMHVSRIDDDFLGDERYRIVINENMDNLNPACKDCNGHKALHTIEDLRREIGFQVERARRYSVNFQLAEAYGLIVVTGKPVEFYFEKVARGDNEVEFIPPASPADLGADPRP